MQFTDEWSPNWMLPPFEIKRGRIKGPRLCFETVISLFTPRSWTLLLWVSKQGLLLFILKRSPKSNRSWLSLLISECIFFFFFLLVRGDLVKKIIHFSFFLRNVAKIMAKSWDRLHLKSTPCPFNAVNAVRFPQLNFWKLREMLEICEIRGDCPLIFLLFLGELSSEQLRELLHKVLLCYLARRCF